MKKNGMDYSIRVLTMPEDYVPNCHTINQACDKWFAKRGIVNNHAAMKNRIWNRRKTK
jgi:hypothetical protein